MITHSRSRRFVLSIATPALALAACTTGDDGPPPCVVSAISVAPTTALLVIGSELVLVASLTQANCGAGAPIEWRSSAPTIAAVANTGTSGIVSAVNPGTAVITVSASGTNTSVSASSTITVSGRPVATVRVTPENPTIVIGGVVQLSAELRDANGVVLTGRAVTWSTSNAAVATVTNAGAVTGVAQGSARITATAEGRSGFADVTVTTVPVASVTIAPSTATLQPAGTVQLTATARDVSGNAITGRTFTWTSSAQGVATVSSQGLVTGVSAGTSTITATTDGVSGTAQINVSPGSDVGRFGWATIENTTGVPTVTRSFNGKSGTVSVTREDVGRYRVSFGLMGDPLGARSETSETVIVSTFKTLLRTCGLSDWNDNGPTLDVNVRCTDLGGTFADAEFNVLVVGRGTLSGPSGFVRATSLAADYAPDLRWAWNSADAPMRLTLSGSSRIVNFGANSGQGSGYQATILNPTTPGVCAPFGFTANSTFASMRCFGGSGFTEDRFFTMLMVQGGRASKAGARYGFAAVETPTSAQYQPAASVARSSSGGAITVTRLALGQWRVRFAGLAAAGGAIAEAAFVTSLGQPYGACVVDSFGPTGADLDVVVRCVDRFGAAVDHMFSVLVIE